ncbi:Putative B3 domain-containing protein At2g27410 [Linum perenne]
MSLPTYFFLTEETLREQEQDPQTFNEYAAEIERKNAEWDTDGGYATLFQEAREAAAGDETTAERFFFEKLADIAARRFIQLEREREERKRKLAEEEEEEGEEHRRSKKAKKTPVAAAEERPKKMKKKSATPLSRGFNGGKIDFAAVGLDPPPRGFADVIKERIDGARDVKLVIMKELFETDLSRNHNRLSIPEKQIIDKDFLTAAEVASLIGTPPPAMSVLLIGPTEEESTNLTLKRWALQNSVSYVLNHGWSALTEKFPDVFRKKAIVQLWSFRTADGELRFWIHGIGQPGANFDDQNSRSRSDGSGGESVNEGGDVTNCSKSSSGTEEEAMSAPLRLLPPPM